MPPTGVARFVDQAATALAMLAASIPSFWLGLILMQVFAVRFDLFPVSGYGGPGSTFADRMYHLIAGVCARDRLLGADPAIYPRLDARRARR
jgi:ABC-type dipeptide/oligopeptide/nickel transport system permease component